MLIVVKVSSFKEKDKLIILKSRRVIEARVDLVDAVWFSGVFFLLVRFYLFNSHLFDQYGLYLNELVVENSYCFDVVVVWFSENDISFWFNLRYSFPCFDDQSLSAVAKDKFGLYFDLNSFLISKLKNFKILITICLLLCHLIHQLFLTLLILRLSLKLIKHIQHCILLRFANNIFQPFLILLLVFLFVFFVLI
jgi:hypothetical protein